ncbi:DUF2971 domain-containing protein [Akkermansia glycaniphila]|uniref:DUF2971 domain-containing protein n=1 Tax=Akkermansia glycaniphila TaxID=1679444 RepID=UPI001C018AC7|nr:DUF2971 domain-containing protein [Akkermansia glycaniphila]MBT9448768.1 DUF2971 domain-containing protein [Akkermansia glycaniphila]
MPNHTPGPKPEPPKSITLYKYMPWEIAEKVLTNWELKLTLPHHTNDPFELMPAKGVEYPWGDQSERCCNLGFICFSKTNTSAALWGHYGDSHRGAVLEFTFPLVLTHDIESKEIKRAYIDLFPDIDPVTLLKITYTQKRFGKKRQSSTGKNTGHVFTDYFNKMWEHLELLSMKDDSWSFEQEYRIICFIDQASSIRNGMVFLDKPMDFLSGIYLGIKCPHNTAYVTSMLANIIRTNKQELTIEDDCPDAESSKVIGITQMKCHDKLFQVIPDKTNNYGLLMKASRIQPCKQRYSSDLFAYANKRICMPDRLYTPGF